MESLSSLLRSKPPTLKSLLADLGCDCEAVNCIESEEEVEEMMTQPDKGYKERELVIGWIADRLEKQREATLKKNQNDTDENPPPPKLNLLAAIQEGDDEENCAKNSMEELTARLSEMAIPAAKGLVEGRLERGLAVQTWALVLRTTKEGSGDCDRDEEVSEALSAAISRPLTQLGGGGNSTEQSTSAAVLRLLPRDIDREVRPKFKKILPPSEGKLAQISQSTREGMEKMRSECEAKGDCEEAVGAEEVDGLTAAVEECVERFEDFGAGYSSTYGRWVERQIAVAEPESVGEAAVKAGAALKANAAARKTAAEIKSRVLAVKERAARLEAMPKFRSRLVDRERS